MVFFSQRKSLEKNKYKRFNRNGKINLKNAKNKKVLLSIEY